MSAYFGSPVLILEAFHIVTAGTQHYADITHTSCGGVVVDYS